MHLLLLELHILGLVVFLKLIFGNHHVKNSKEMSEVALSLFLIFAFNKVISGDCLIDGFEHVLILPRNHENGLIFERRNDKLRLNFLVLHGLRPILNTLLHLDEINLSKASVYLRESQLAVALVLNKNFAFLIMFLLFVLALC